MKRNGAEYKFTQNLLKASSSSCKTVQDAIPEWIVVFEEVRINEDGLCLCQRKHIKYLKYIFNLVTKKIATVGSVCCENFNFNPNKIKNKTFEEIIKINLLKGEYQNIDNIDDYSNSIEKQFIEYFEKYSSSKNISELKKVTQNIKNLIADFKLNFLEDIYNTLTSILLTQINVQLELEELEKTRREKEMIKKGQMPCYRCSNSVDENYKKYENNSIACKECVKLIDHWLSKGFGKISFTF
jgi:hypothetical protein